ncbi:hypothetical protein PM082_013932 [Marasmius tenuissimus]|nr:hypothetical protein PM082_001522 [Marasmius tenuissimus]KAJ8088685.1 hypothetical protein PM082_013928 [Marasmius tenuissimus]KAJ8088689.1 hypothetical protein PM082_013932 [Marasmius tenuissimus]
MGSKVSWSERAVAKDTRSLNEFCLTEGFRKNHREQRSLILGVHANDLLDSLKADSHPYIHAEPPVKTFFGILSKYSEAAAVFLFVFDSSTSRKYTCRDKGLYHDARCLILNFGYYFIEAEGEAVSLLASLSRSHAIDGVISEDNYLTALNVGVLLRISR